jgi:hypothetical protein
MLFSAVACICFDVIAPLFIGFPVCLLYCRNNTAENSANGAGSNKPISIIYTRRYSVVHNVSIDDVSIAGYNDQSHK